MPHPGEGLHPEVLIHHVEPAGAAVRHALAPRSEVADLEDGRAGHRLPFVPSQRLSVFAGAQLVVGGKGQPVVGVGDFVEDHRELVRADRVAGLLELLRVLPHPVAAFLEPALVVEDRLEEQLPLGPVPVAVERA
ncbi:MAG: hypothetical protein CO096_13495, partial [Armatimonadetes bacterium CG_4_9_14_3_um_filter_66_14]